MTYTPMELAQAFIKTGEIDDALEALNQQLSAAPDDQTARRLRAEVLARRPDAASLRAAIEDLNGLDQQEPTDLLRIAGLFERLGEVDAALSLIHKARSLYPDDVRLTEREILLLIGQGGHAAALEIIAQQPQAWQWMQLAGDASVRAGQYPQAVDYYTQAITQLAARLTDDESAWANGMRARLLLARASARLKLGALDAADADYVAAGTLIAADPMIQFNRAVIIALRGDLQSAKTVIRSVYEQASPALRDVMRADLEQDARLAGMLDD